MGGGIEKTAQEPRGPVLTSAGIHSAAEQAKVFRPHTYGRLLIKQFQGDRKASKLKAMVIMTTGCCVTLNMFLTTPGFHIQE